MKSKTSTSRPIKGRRRSLSFSQNGDDDPNQSDHRQTNPDHGRRDRENVNAKIFFQRDSCFGRGHDRKWRLICRQSHWVIERRFSVGIFKPGDLGAARALPDVQFVLLKEWMNVSECYTRLSSA